MAYKLGLLNCSEEQHKGLKVRENMEYWRNEKKLRGVWSTECERGVGKNITGDINRACEIGPWKIF